MVTDEQAFRYDLEWRQGGAEKMLWSAVVASLGAVMILWGFGQLPWAWPAALGLLAGCAVLFARGVWIRRVSSAVIALDGEGIHHSRGAANAFLRFADITDVTFVGRLQPAVVLRSGGTSIRVYKTLYGYPAFWATLRGRLPMPQPDRPDLLVRCNRVFRPMPLIAGFALSALFLAFGINDLIGSAATGSAVAMLALGAVTSVIPSVAVAGSIRSLRCGRRAIEFRSPFWAWQCPADQLERVTLIQEKNSRLDGPSNIPAYRRLPPPRGYGLALVLRRKDGAELVVSDLITSYPLELLYEYLNACYKIANGAGAPDDAAAPENNRQES